MRKLTGLTLMILLALLVAACGGDDNGDPTEEATTAADIATEALTEVAEETATADATETEATTESVIASPPVSAATPATMDVAGVTAATPAAATGTPMASPVAATPVSSAPAAVSGDHGATPAAGTQVTLSGRVVLPGTANEAWVITDDGCVGLGAHGDMQAGRQLVVRDADGAIVGVSALAASDTTDSCAWTFSLDVPESSFYAVSIPMVVEHIFTQQEVEQDNGEVVVPIS